MDNLIMGRNDTVVTIQKIIRSSFFIRASPEIRGLVAKGYLQSPFRE